MLCLTLHTLEDEIFDIRFTYRRPEEQWVHRCEIPRAKSLPHEVHSSWPKRDEVGKRVVGKECLVVFGMMRAAEPRLFNVISTELWDTCLIYTYQGYADSITSELNRWILASQPIKCYLEFRCTHNVLILMEDWASREVASKLDHGHPRENSLGLTSEEDSSMLGIFSVQPLLVIVSKVHRTIEFSCPFQVCAVKMGMRNSNGS